MEKNFSSSLRQLRDQKDLGMSLLESQRSSWGNHSKILCENLHNMFLEQAMCDIAITFKTNKNQHVSKTIGAHRAVLSAMSPVFKERILASTGGTAGHILELEHDPGTIEKLLSYIYTGNLMGDCSEVTRCANELEICGIDQLSKFETEVHSGFQFYHVPPS